MPANLETFTTCAGPGTAKPHTEMGGIAGFIIGVISVVTQFFLVSFIIRRFGVTTALLVLPAAMAIALKLLPEFKALRKMLRNKGLLG